MSDTVPTQPSGPAELHPVGPVADPTQPAADPWRATASLAREAITNPQREVFVRLVLLLTICAGLVIAIHLAGVPMPWAPAP